VAHSYLTDSFSILSERDVIEALQGHASSRALFDGLVASEILVPADRDELSKLLDDNAAIAARNVSLYRAIIPSPRCNFSCSYCGQKHEERTMSASVQADIEAEIERKLSSGKYEKLTIGWFGGEPLTSPQTILQLSQNLKACSNKYRVQYSAKIATNGYALSTKTIKMLLEECAVRKIEITLDGPSAIHDLRRDLKGGRGTFARIVDNVSNLLLLRSPETEVVIRCNVDEKNAANVPELITYMHKCSWAGKVRVYFAPVHDWGTFEGTILENKIKLSELEVDWLMLLRHLGFTVGFLPRRKHVTCLATDKDALLVNYDGAVYDCTEVPLTDAVRTYAPSELGARPDHFSNFSKTVAQGGVPCTGCAKLPVCGGACPKQWAEGKNPCPTFKFAGERRLIQAVVGSHQG
jgi:uncharacterized protein